MSGNLLRISAHDDDKLPLLTMYCRIARDAGRFLGCVHENTAMFMTPEMVYTRTSDRPVAKPFTCSPATYREFVATGYCGAVNYLRVLADDVPVQRYLSTGYGVPEVMDTSRMREVDEDTLSGAAARRVWLFKNMMMVENKEPRTVVYSGGGTIGAAFHAGSESIAVMITRV